MNSNDQKAILSIALLAAFADSTKAETEREEIRRIAESLGARKEHVNLSTLYQDVLLKRVNLADVTVTISEPNLRSLAYEMAVCVCEADGTMSEPERAFLQELQQLLGLNDVQAKASSETAHSLAAITAKDEGSLAANVPKISDAELDKSILNYSILNGALELLPQSWASMAVIPLQIKMVYVIGKTHGYELDKGHIKEFLTTAGVGMTSQYLEQLGRKLIGGLLGQIAGGLGKGIGSAATGIAFSFASTYALGQLAKRYYADGRQMNTQLLKDTYQSFLTQAKELQQKHLPEIQQKAQTLDASTIMEMVRSP